jgi:hypothetical protein
MLDTTKTQANTNNVKKTWTLLHTTEGTELSFYEEIVTNITTPNSERTDT